MEQLIFLIIIFVGVCISAYVGEKSDGRGRSRNILYEKKLSDPRWKMKREKILDRDGHRCAWCGRTDRLQVHHKYYMKYPDGRFAEPWDYPDDKLITLCENCHRKWHEKHKVKVYYRKWGVHYE